MRNAIVFFFLVLLACSPSDEPKVADQSYFPLRVGNYWIYQVNETDIQQLTCGTGGQTDQSYQWKDVITDSVKNAEQGYTYTIHRYTRPDATQPWTDLANRSARINVAYVVVNEDNVPYVKIMFPLRDSATWNGNLYNDLGEEDYKIKSVGAAYTLASGNKYQQALTIFQRDERNLVYRDTRIEVYAAAVGLIYKETTQLNYFTSADCFGLGEVKDGAIYLQSLISYGHQ